MAGRTPEAIYNDALKIKKEMNEAKLKEQMDGVKKARTDLIIALDEYIYALLDERLDPEQAKEMEDSLKKIERAIFTYDNEDKSTKEKDDRMMEVMARLLRL